MSTSLARAFPSLLARAGVRAEARVLVAVSGGADSMALLHLLHFHGGLAPGTLHVAHYEHGMGAGTAWSRRPLPRS